MYSVPFGTGKPIICIKFRQLHNAGKKVFDCVNDMSALVSHFMSSPREREKSDSRGDEREDQGRKEQE